MSENEENVIEEKTYYDEDGEEVKFPGDPEFIKQQLEVSKTASEKLKELEANQEKLTNELKGYKDKDYNFSALRKKAEDKDQKLTEAEEIALKQQDQIDALTAKVSGSWEANALSKVAGKDEETRKKVQEAYNTLNIKAETEAEIEEKYKKAALLADVSVSKGSISSVSRDLGGLPPVGETNVKKLTPEQKEMGKALGLSEEDYKKYKV